LARPYESLPPTEVSPIAFVSVLVFTAALLVTLFEIAFETAIIGWPWRILFWLLILVSGYALLNVFAWLRNTTLFRKRLDLPPSRRLLTIVAHQDDETVAAGCSILQTLRAGGQACVLYTTNGVTRRKFPTDGEARAQAELRQRESLKALAIAGVDASYVESLGFENENHLWSPSTVQRAIEIVAKRIK